MIEARLDDFLVECKYCQARVVWADGLKPGQRIPFDVDPDAMHEIGVWSIDAYEPITLKGMRRAARRLKATHVTLGQQQGMMAAGIRLYSHHAQHCPRKDEWYRVGDHGDATRRPRGGKR